MFLIDAQITNRDKKRGLDLLFKVKIDTYRVWRVEIPEYFLIGCKLEPIERCKNTRDADGCFEAIPYVEEGGVAVVRSFACSRALPNDVLARCKDCFEYESDLDIKSALVRALFVLEIELYQFYNYKNNSYIVESEGTFIDSTGLQKIKDHIDAPKWAERCSIYTIYVNYRVPNYMNGPIIPRIDQITERTTGWTKDELEILYGYSTVESIVAYDGITEMKWSRSSKEEDDSVVIGAFLDSFHKTNPDIVQFFNTSHLNFLYERCQHLGNETLKKFVYSMNRAEYFPGMDMKTIIEHSMVSVYNWDIQLKTSGLYDYGIWSKESYQKTRVKLVGRILWNYMASLRKRDPLQSATPTIDDVHRHAKTSLAVVLAVTGQYHMSIDWYGCKTKMTYWIVKKIYGHPLVFVSKPKTGQKREFGGDPKEKHKEKSKGNNGGLTWKVEQKTGVYRRSETHRIIQVDLAGAYGNNIAGNNLDITTIRTCSGEEGTTTDVCGKHVLKPHVRTGIIPSIVDKLLVERRAVKKELLNPSLTREEKEILDLRNKIAKEIIATVYGVLGGEWDTNSLAAPNVSALVAEIGRMIWNKLVIFLITKGHEIIQGTTDGVMIYTSKFKTLAADLIEFQKDGCQFVCYPEIREELYSVYIKNDQNWIGVECVNGSPGQLINKGVIRTGVPEIQIIIEKACFSLLLRSEPGNALVVNLLKYFQAVLIEWSRASDPDDDENYFKYYCISPRKKTTHFSPRRYADEIKSSFISILKLALYGQELNSTYLQYVDSIAERHMII